MTKFHSLRCILASGLLAAVPHLVMAQAWPAKTITLVVPQSPGTAVDTMSRVIAKVLGERLSQAVVVDNKPGGSGNIGANIVVAAAPDGYSVLVAANNLSIAPYVTRNLAWDPVRDFAPLAMPAMAPLILAANLDVNARNLGELVALVKTQPGKINYGSSGKGTPHHLAMAQLQQASGMELFHVPFKSLGEMITAMVGNQVQIGFAAPGNVLPLAKAGKLKLFAVSAPGRLPQAPDLPTLRELGLPAAETQVWVGMFAPSRTPADIVNRYSKEMDEVVKAAEFKDTMNNLGFLIPSPSNADRMAAQLREDKVKMPKLLQAAGVGFD